MRVMDFLSDRDGAIEMIDGFWVIASFPIDQADVADGLAFFEAVTQLLLYFQGTTEEIECSSPVTQVLVAVADESECDGLAMAVLEFSICRKRLFLFGECSRWSSGGIDAFGVGKEFVGRCSVLRWRRGHDHQY